MSIEAAEQLKKDLTDRFVVVKNGVPELKRFQGLTGKVRTVNMNGQALVEFDNAVDISWYDVDPAFLKVVDEPVKKEKPAAANKDAPARKPAPAKPAGKSPLEMARAQGAAQAGGADAAEKPAGKKLSPLELARQQGAAGAARKPAPAKTESAEKPAGKKLSPLELARQQGAANKESAEDATAAAEPQQPADPEAAADTPPEQKPAEKPAANKNLSPLELARQQGAFKG